MLRAFQGDVVGKRVDEAEVLEAEYVDPNDVQLQEKVIGYRIEKAERRGKYVLISLDSDYTLVYHMGMTGWLELRSQTHEPRKHDQLMLRLEAGNVLCYGCVRKIGSVHLVEDRDFSELKTLNHMGIEPLSQDFTWNTFTQLLDDHGRSMAKTFLMNQEAIAGIGNEYSDEILYHSRIHPRTKVSDLWRNQRRRLYQETKGVLTRAVQHYDEIHSEASPWLIVRREEGVPCPRCEGTIQRVKVSGRSAYFCPKCQGEA